MSGFPTPKVHRPSRRKLGRGQYPQISAGQVVAVPSASTIVLTFSEPVVVSGIIDLHLAITPGPAPAFASQDVLSTTSVRLTYGGAVAGCDYSFTGESEPVRTYAGGGVAPIAGTFP